MPTLGERMVMGWGKLRRTAMMAVSKKRVVRDMQRRIGACNRCGACCKLMFKCPAYDETDGNPKCLVYNDRPGVCSLFPINEQDLKERDIVMPSVKCGFTFISEEEFAAKHPNGDEELPKKIALDQFFDRGTRTVSGPWAIMKFALFKKNGHGNGNGHPKA